MYRKKQTVGKPKLGYTKAFGVPKEQKNSYPNPFKLHHYKCRAHWRRQCSRTGSKIEGLIQRIREPERAQKVHSLAIVSHIKWHCFAVLLPFGIGKPMKN